MKMSNPLESSFLDKILDPVTVQHIQRPGIIAPSRRQPDGNLHIFSVYQKLFDILNGAVPGVLSHIVRVCQDVLQLCTVFGEVRRVGGLHMDKVCLPQIDTPVPGDSDPQQSLNIGGYISYLLDDRSLLWCLFSLWRSFWGGWGRGGILRIPLRCGRCLWGGFWRFLLEIWLELE